jgi:phosphoglycerol transferase
LVAKLRAEHALIILPFALALWSISRVWTVLPSIMQDEYIYTSQAKNLPFAEQFYSNYLFSWVMGLTNSCGTEFYACTKGINSIFFLGTVFFTFLIARRFLSFRWSVFVASVTALSPIAVPVSYFMPETMYFSMMTITIWVTLVISRKENWLLWAVSGLTLGATALVKPHAIFMLPAFVVFAFVFAYKKFDGSWIQGIKAGLAVAAGFLVTKLGLGFAFAGTEGLKLFGGYGSPVGALTGAATAEEVAVGSEGVARSGLEVLVTVASSHLLMHASAMLLLAGIPLILSLRVSYSVAKTKQPIGEVSSLFVLVALITASMIGVVALFEAYVTASGDDHSDRLILRYYEFLIPQFIVMGLLLPRFTDSKRLLRIIQGSIVVAASMFFTIYYPPTFDKQYADASTLPGIGDTQGFFVFVGLFVSSAVIFWIVNPEKGNLVIGRFIMPAVLILALVMSQNKLIEINGTAAYFDQAGWDSRSYLQDVPGDRILVIGQTRTEVFTVKFWIDEANIRDLLVVEGSVISSENVSDTDYVVTLGNIGIDFNHEVVTEGEGYRLVRVVN